MSRLIVKGIPKYYTEQNLEKHFSTQGIVTDVKILRKRSGESRRFAFVGFKSSEEAEKSITFFNKTFIDTCRIEVDQAKSFSDPDKPLPVKLKKSIKEKRLKEQEERLKENKKNKKRKISSVNDEIENNPKLKEFITAMKPANLRKSWANDETIDGTGGIPSTEKLEEELAHQDQESQQIQQESERKNPFPFEELDSVVPTYKQDRANVADEQYLEDAQGSELATDEKVSDLDWLKSKSVPLLDESKSESKDKAQEGNDAKGNIVYDLNNNEDTQLYRDPVYTRENNSGELIEEIIQETGRLFVRNISYASTEDGFRRLFEQYGPIEEVHIAIDTRTGSSKGFLYVQFMNSADAVNAYKALDKQIFEGRILHLLPADKKKSHRLDEFDLENLSFKKQRELKKKSQASKERFSWNSLYMNNDAVLDSVSEKLGISKSDLIDPQNSNSAVRQALAEAHVIGDVRKYFENKGIELSSFHKKERDDRIILVKNFSYGTTSEEIGELFGLYGRLKRILMPPAGTIAIIEYRDAPSARAAFTKLAYKRFKNSILYLEKGPKDLFIQESEGLATAELNREGQAVEPKMSAEDVLGEPGTNDDEILEGPTTSVFVKNLNFETTSEKLSDAFRPFPGFVVAIVKCAPNPKKENSLRSLGFGFVEFKDLKQAKVAISTMDGYILDGHKLQLKLSHRRSGQVNSKKQSGQKSKKLIIKNLPFEASRRDLVELFSSFGQLKSVRVPQKFDRSARGFAFVEFTLMQEAENAMNQLEGVHLLGRRLVMQYSQQESENVEEEIEKMTNKVKNQVATQKVSSARLTGKGKSHLQPEEGEELL